MKRWLTTLAFTVSLVLAAALTVIWVRGFFVTSQIAVERNAPDPTRAGYVIYELLSVEMGCRELRVQRIRKPTRGWYGASGLTARYSTVKVQRTYGGENGLERLGFRFSTSNQFPYVPPTWRVGVPAVLVVAPFALSTFVLARAVRRAEARHAQEREGRCRECGYDLRGAAHERCPECGEAVAAVVQV